MQNYKSKRVKKLGRLFFFKTIFLVLIIFLSCSSNSSQTKPIKSDKNHETIRKKNQNNLKLDNYSVDKYVGTYKYTYQENSYIVLKSTNGILTGYYYGTSDEFDENRAGYYASYFVANMENLKIENNSINFTLNIESNDLFEKPIKLGVFSSEDTRKAGYKAWDGKIPTPTKKYVGQLIDSNTIYFKGSFDFLDKTFKRIKDK